LRGFHVTTDVVADHDGPLRRHTEQRQRRLEERSGGLSEHHGLLSRGVFEGAHEGADVEAQPVLGAPVAGHAQGHEMRLPGGHEQAEGAVEGGEVPRLAQIAQHHGAGPFCGFPGRLQTAELGGGGGRHEQGHRLIRVLPQPLAGGYRRGEDARFIHLDPQPREFLHQGAAWAGGGIGEEQVGNAPFLEPAYRIGRTGHHGIAFVEYAVEIEENGFRLHGPSLHCT